MKHKKLFIYSLIVVLLSFSLGVFMGRVTNAEKSIVDKLNISSGFDSWKQMSMNERITFVCGAMSGMDYAIRVMTRELMHVEFKISSIDIVNYIDKKFFEMKDKRIIDLYNSFFEDNPYSAMVKKTMVK